jgi:predicted esterase
MLFMLVLAAFAQGAGSVKLEPTARWHLFFPDLPDTLATLVRREKRPAQLTVWLPANYSGEGKFPIFLILDGDDGGFGDRLPLRPGTIGSNDFIYVNLPLFKRGYTGTNDSKIVTMEDYDSMSRAYRVMLQKLFDTVPNAVAERSAFGGFSNGAHALGVLLARRDEFTLQHFRSFYLIEGGFGSLAACMAIPGVAPALRQSRILLMYGDQPLPDDDPTRIVHDHLARACALRAKQDHFDLTSIVMRGYGHELPPKYDDLLGVWVRGEKLPESEKQ